MKKLMIVILLILSSASFSAFSQQKGNDPDVLRLIHHFSQEEKEKVEDILKLFQDITDVDQRILRFGEFFLDRPYGHSQKLFEKFVCTTLVEQVLALSFATDGKFLSYEKSLNSIYFKGKERGMVFYNHFPSRDWIPNIIEKGMALDVTESLSLKYFHRSEKAKALINRRGWYQAFHKAYLEDFDKAFPQEEASEITLPYISLKDIFLQDNPANPCALRDADFIRSIPNGSIIHVVRPNWQVLKRENSGTASNVSHVGFAIRDKDGQLFFLHASFHKDLGKEHVLKEDFTDYFCQYTDSETIKGFNVLKIQ